MESMKSESRMARKKKTKTVRRTPIKILWSMVMVLSTTIRQNLFALALFCPGRYNDDGNGDGANETLFIDAIVVESVAPVVIVLRRPNTLKRILRFPAFKKINTKAISEGFITFIKVICDGNYVRK